MNLLPIVGRELRVAARRRGTYRMRFAVALLGLGLSAWMLLTLRIVFVPQQAGQQIFFVLSGLAFLYCLFAGAQTTADCLSGEKREGTLGLLFLTDLKGYDIVAGKLAATSLNTVYALLAILPVMALPLLMGGVSASAFWRVALALVNTLFFSLAAGMFVSSVSRLERSAVVRTISLILLIAGGLPLCLEMWKEAWNKPVPDALKIAILFSSPGYALGLAMESASLARVNTAFWWSSLAVNCIGWVFLLLAVRIVPRSWTDRAVSASPRSWGARLSRWRYGSAEWRRELRLRLLACNPITWLSNRNRQLHWNIWFVLGAIAAGWVWGCVEMGREWLTTPAAVAFAILLHGCLKNALGGEACRRFAEDREAGALELLLSTPLGVREILRGQLLALRRLFTWPVIVVLVADMFLLLGAIKQDARAPLNLSEEEVRYLVETFVAGVVVLVADLVTLGWLGMWSGLRASSYARAYGNTVGCVLVLPWGVFIFTLFTAGAATQWRSEPGFEIVLLWWFLLALINDVILFTWARSRLLTRFRDEAAQRFQPSARRRWWWPFQSRATG